MIAVILAISSSAAVWLDYSSKPPTEGTIIESFKRNMLHSFAYTVITILFHLLFTSIQPGGGENVFGINFTDQPWPADMSFDQFILGLEARYRIYLQERTIELMRRDQTQLAAPSPALLHHHK
jgi:hypothetical protein